MVPEGLEGGLGGNTVRVLVLPYEIFSSTPTSCYIMKSSLAFLHILWFYTMLRSVIFTCAKTYVLIDPLLCNKNTTASHSRFTLELLTPGGLLLHVTPLKCVALWFRTWTLSKWAKLSAIECTKTHGKSHTKFLNLLEFSQKNGSIVRSLQNTGRVELDVHHVSPNPGWYVYAYGLKTEPAFCMFLCHSWG